MSVLTKQLIAFNRNKIYTSNNTPSIPEGRRLELLVSLTNELKKFCMTIDSEAILYLSEDDIINFYNDVIPALENRYKVYDTFKPLYPGFPKQVIEKSDLDLWTEQHKIYDSLKETGEFDYDKFEEEHPWYSDKEVDKIKRNKYITYVNITRLSDEEFMKIPYRIAISNNSLQSTTKDELVWFLTNYSTINLPENIPFKETLCIVMKYRDDYEVRNINDILRYSMYMMGSDPCLVQVKKKIKASAWRRSGWIDNPAWRDLKGLSRAERKKILGMIERLLSKKDLGSLIPDARREYGHWVLLSERVHSGDYKNIYPKAREFFETLQTRSLSKKYKSWNSYIQKLYDSNTSIMDITKKISERPGELVRRFDSLVRRAEKQGLESDVMDIFLSTTGMKNKTLFELLDYYDKRESDAPRLIKIKGTNAITELPKLDGIDSSLLAFIREVITRKILTNIKSYVKEQDLIGKTVYLDNEVKNIPIPKGMRSSTSIMPSGTKFDIPAEKNFIRFFVRWMQLPDKHEDLDLHAYLSNGEDRYTNIGWNTGYKAENLCAVHSGDVLDRPGNCAEYVDIDIKKCLESGFKYVIMDVMNYKGRSFNTLPCWLGYDYRTELRGDVKDWEPNEEGVTFCQEIKSDTHKIAAWLFDLENRKAILIDAAMDTIPVNSNNEQMNIIKYYTTEHTLTTYEVVEEYYKARGAQVVNDDSVLIDENVDLSECIYANDLVLDYTRVLEMIGE